MVQIEEVNRTVPGAELFFGESVAQYLADLSDEAYSEEKEAAGFLLGRFYRDARGTYAVVSGVTQDVAKAGSAVGIFRSSLSGGDATQEDVRRAVSVFGYTRSYLIVIDAVQGAMGMYLIDNGVARKVLSAMVENL